MASPSIETPQRPRVASTQSFSRLEAAADSSATPVRTRASTVHTPSIVSVPEARKLPVTPEDGSVSDAGDVFQSSDQLVDEEESGSGNFSKEYPEGVVQLPIEIQSALDRFLRSLSVKSHTAPLTIQAIAELFQDFYVQAESHIALHIATLTTRLSRDKSPVPPRGTPAASKAKHRSNTVTDDHEDQQMLTATEIADKKKARRLLETQRAAFEESVERLVCERVYDKIYRHRSTDDEERDAKLRSKTAALSLLGIGLNELHVNVPTPPDGDVKRLQTDIYDQLGPARDELQRMDDEHYPAGKLQHLILAHQSIVATLARVFPSSSSADEVLPTLIYTLVTSPPETMNIASNLHFVQLFRAAAKMDGEAAYCLVNLEAAVSFLETVDLSSLRTQELSPTPGLEKDGKVDKGADDSGSRPHRITSLTADLPAVSNPSGSAELSGSPKPPPPAASASGVRQSSGNQRRLSHMLQMQAERIEDGRQNLLQSADQAFDSINSTLENSFNFLFGRMKEQEKESRGSPVIMPKTLDEARKLVMSPTQPQGEDAFIYAQRHGDVGIIDDPLRRPSNASGAMSRLTPRDASVDSSKSGSSMNRRATMLSGEEKAVPAPETVGSFVGSFNPLSRFGVTGFPKFGRTVNSPPPEQVADKGALKTALQTQTQTRSRSTSVSQEADLNAAEALAHLRKAKPPIKRFLAAKDASELRLGEINDLLNDYRRLAELLGEAITS